MGLIVCCLRETLVEGSSFTDKCWVFVVWVHWVVVEIDD